jgi:parallel beta-helix repeat protein
MSGGLYLRNRRSVAAASGEGQKALRRLVCSLVLAAAMGSFGVVGEAAAHPPTTVSCGATISAPGQYYLGADCTGAGIVINDASDVDLKLDGHTLNGGEFRAVGIFVRDFPAPVSGVRIEGPGTITGYSFGVIVGGSGPGVSDSQVRDLMVTNGSAGIFVRVDVRGNRITHNAVNDNMREGIDVQGTGNELDANTASGNRRGIFVEAGATGNKLHGNTALGNSPSDDLFDGNPGCDSNHWDGNHFATANQSCIH